MLRKGRSEDQDACRKASLPAGPTLPSSPYLLIPLPNPRCGPTIPSPFPNHPLQHPPLLIQKTPPPTRPPPIASLTQSRTHPTTPPGATNACAVFVARIWKSGFYLTIRPLECTWWPRQGCGIRWLVSAGRKSCVKMMRVSPVTGTGGIVSFLGRARFSDDAKLVGGLKGQVFTLAIC